MRKRIFAVLLCLVTFASLIPARAFASEELPEPTQLQITQQPVDVFATAGQTVETTVLAQGDGLTYQWYFKNPYHTDFYKSSITTETYTWKITQKDSGRLIYCVIKDTYGNMITTDTVVLKIYTELKITKQPTDVFANDGKQVETAVAVQGDGLTYQWYFRNPYHTAFHKSSLTTPTYTWKMTKKDSGRLVYCVITDEYGNCVTTNKVTLKIPSVRITKQPTNAGAAVGATVKTSVTAEGEGLRYQWYFKNPSQSKFNKSSITSATYTWKMTQKDSGRLVYCVITDKFGYQVTTDTVTLKIPTALKITKQPKDVLTKLGTVAQTTVAATGDGLKYQWYVLNPGKESYVKSAVTGNYYSFTVTKENVGRRIYCVISDMFGNQKMSNIVTISAAKANFDRTLYKVKPGATRTVDLKIQPADTKDEIVWTSSNPTIAKVNSKGVITGVKNGTVTITARGKNTGFVATCKLKVCNVKQVAVTFDDGPGKRTGELLDFLKENDIRVTFFLVGQNMSGKQSVVKRQAAEGHEIGYHSWKHDIQTGLSTEKIKSDYVKANNLLKSYTGKGFTLWRTPGGGYNTRVLNAIDLPHIYWSVDTLDWKYRSSSRTCSVIKNNAKDGSIILLHDIHSTTVTGAMQALKDMQNGDYEFLTVTELLSRNGNKPKANTNYIRG